MMTRTAQTPVSRSKSQSPLDDEMNNVKILVVDDDSGCRRLTSRVLNVFGYGSVSACNGLEALDVLNHEAIDLILLDLMMPEMDGLTFVRVMRKDPRWARVPVLVLSGIADHEVAKKVRESGAQGFLVKSHYTIDELVSQVRAQLSHPPTAQNAN